MKKIGARRTGGGKKARELSGGCLSVFGLPFLAAGLFMTGMYFKGFADWWQAASWEEVPCWVMECELEQHDDGDGTTYEALATYRYEFEGREYVSSRVSLEGGADNIGDFQKRVHRDLSELARSERAFRCFVNPEEPEEAVLYRELRWSMQAFMAIFALTFPAVGAGLVVGGVVSTVRAKGLAGLRKRHPDEPWRWRPEWTGEAVAEGVGGGWWWRVALLAYAVWSGAIVWTLMWGAWASGAFEEGAMAWMLWIFVAIWCVPAWFALRQIRARMMLGRVALELDEWPVWPGGELAGAVVLGRPLPMRAEARVKVLCERKERTGSGDDTKTLSEELWSDERVVTAAEMNRRASGFRLPVRIGIPADLPEMELDEGGSEDRTWHEWKLVMKVAGTPVKAEFAVPVFRTAKSQAVAGGAGETAGKMADESAGKSAGEPRVLAAEDLVRGLREVKIRAEFDGNGWPLSLVSPPARNPGMLVFLVLFNLVWTGAAVFLVTSDAPLLFKLIWPVTATGIWCSVLWSLLHKRTCRFDPLCVTVTNQLGVVAWTRVVEKREMTGFPHDSNMESNDTKYYRVRVLGVDGKKLTLADGITSQRLARALAAAMEEWRRG
ncbi:MAG: DUF3592 domain-containing protein [Verrucomicrobiota bacterium JB025]|nr:DUF3592 domain-containing protein [Verrucomicrobiota bacterium JB025]